MKSIPNVIQEVVGNQPYEEEQTGMSGARVLMFPDYVLKIRQESEETENERDMVSWLSGRLPVPEIPVYTVENGVAYTLMTRVRGSMLCAEEYLKQPRKLIRCAAKALQMLWGVDVKNCPCQTSRLKNRLIHVRELVEQQQVDLEHVDPHTFGPGGFRNPEELLHWLEDHRPKEDLVLTHGDFCLPNILAEGEVVRGFIDLGKTGPADRWQDVALVLRSLKDNFTGKYSGGETCFDFHPQMLLDELRMEMDEEKYRYYLLLDELF